MHYPEREMHRSQRSAGGAVIMTMPVEAMIDLIILCSFDFSWMLLIIIPLYNCKINTEQKNFLYFVDNVYFQHHNLCIHTIRIPLLLLIGNKIVYRADKSLDRGHNNIIVDTRAPEAFAVLGNHLYIGNSL